MKNFASIFLVLTILLDLAPDFARAQTLNQAANQTLSLGEALNEAESNNPKLKSASFQVKAAEQRIRDAHAGYLPTIDLALVGSDGSPGSFAFMGVDNNISAADRIGEGGAATLRQTIWDFGRTSSAVDAASSERDYQNMSAALSSSDLDLQVLNVFLSCSYLKSAIADADFTAHQAKMIASETNNYVRSGQRSVIEKYLVDAQAKEAETLGAELDVRIKSVQQRLQILLGRPISEKLSCPDLDTNEAEVAHIEKAIQTSPVLDVFKASANLAQYQLGQAKADVNPMLFGVVTGGYFNDIEQKDGWNYSAGVALTFPLFDGFHRDAQIERRKAELSSSEALIDYSKQIVDESNSKYNEQIQSLRVRLNFLAAEIKLAKNAFNLAKNRYFGFKGSMIDLREALRNLNRVQLSIDETTRDLLIARGSYAIYNGARSKKMKILIIEDEIKTAAYLKKGLEEESYSVDLAHDGIEGLSLALTSDYDLIILDVMLPNKNGWEIIQELRSAGKQTLALFLTAKDSVDDRIKGLTLGGDAYLVKPFSFSELLAQIRSLLRRIPARLVDTIRVADLEINLARRQAFRAGQNLNLSSREFALLELLARRRGEILSRTVISEQVWDIHYDSGSNVVDVHIRRLRAKVDDPFEVKLIKTIRGMGYLIEQEI